MKYYMYMIFIQCSFFMKIINLDVKLIISQNVFSINLHIVCISTSFGFSSLSRGCWLLEDKFSH